MQQGCSDQYDSQFIYCLSEKFKGFAPYLSKVSLQLKALGGVFCVPAWPGACPCSPCPSWGWGQGAALPSPGRPGKRTRRSPGSQSSAGSPTAS